MKLLILATFLFSLNSFSAIEIYSTMEKRTIDTEEFLNAVVKDGQTIYISENHYNESHGLAQGEIISLVSSAYSESAQIALGWEFLNYFDQLDISLLFNGVKNGGLEAEDLLFYFFKDSENIITYLPVIESLKNVNGELFGLNIPRSIKTQLREKGLSSLDPQYIPENFRLGKPLYFELFKEAMGNHVPKEKVLTYYIAQCFTDAVMHEQITKLYNYDLKFVIAGSFHVDYNLGIAGRNKGMKATIKLVSSLEERQEYVKENKRLGLVADYIVLYRP